MMETSLKFAAPREGALDASGHGGAAPAPAPAAPTGLAEEVPFGNAGEIARPAAPPSSAGLGEGRDAMIRQLDARYGSGTRLLYGRYLWKKYAFLGVVEGATVLKRLIDIGFGLMLLLPALPVGLVVAVLIRATDGGPALFVQRRVGLHGREFAFPKFRSMVADADTRRAALAAANVHGADGVTFKLRRDPRVTWIGRIIRRTSLDELPQLWCVLKGEMSLVGPRPPLPEEVARYTLADRRRLDVKPGLTCLWQVSGRADLAFAEQVRLDLAYMESQSIALDLWLLMRTVPAVLLGRGAY